MSNSVFGYLSDRLANVVSRALPTATTATGNIIVSGAGTPSCDGIYEVSGTLNGKTKYTKSDDGKTISWSGTQWGINGVFYFSTQNVATPDLVSVWLTGAGEDPAPTVTAQTAASAWVSTRNGLTTDDITYPLVYCYAGEATEVMTPGCGVFNVPVTLTYAAKADDITADAYDENWQTLLKYLWDTTLPASLTTTGFHVYGITYGQQAEAIESDERTFARSLPMEVRCMPRSNS